MTTVDVLAQYHNYVSTLTHQWSAYGNYTYTNIIVQNTFSTVWNASYQCVLNTNTFIAAINNSGAVVPDERKKLLLGEAYAMRAFLHFDMLRLFGPVYATDSNLVSIPYSSFATEEIQPLLPAKTVMDSVLKDLGRAENLLQHDPVRTDGVVPTTGIDVIGDFYKLRNRRLNYYAVMALKARALLYRGDKAAALQAAKSVISEAGRWFPWSPAALSNPGIADPDRTFSSEVIFGVQNFDMYAVQRTSFAAPLALNIILAPTVARLAEIYENNENDYRLRVNWGSAASSGKTFKTFIKYDDVINKTPLFRNFQPLIRMSELYYIAAECSPVKSDGIAFLNTVRQNRGLIALTTAAEFPLEITKEYKKEFYGEGQLFFYYKRMNTASVLNGSSTQSVALNPAKYVVPLPLTETQNR